jgi:hypothetical protein
MNPCPPVDTRSSLGFDYLVIAAYPAVLAASVGTQEQSRK